MPCRSMCVLQRIYRQSITSISMSGDLTLRRSEAHGREARDARDADLYLVDVDEIAMQQPETPSLQLLWRDRGASLSAMGGVHGLSLRYG